MRRWPRLFAIWGAAAVLLGGALLAAQIRKSPLNDPDLAYQRPGFLDAHATPFAAPPVTEGIPNADARTVVFFTRPELAGPLRNALQKRRSLANHARVVVVVASIDPMLELPAVPFVGDPDGRLAASYRMRVPKDKGPPVGYAIVDRTGRVRYRTLDPSMARRLNEVETMVRATP